MWTRLAPRRAVLTDEYLYSSLLNRALPLEDGAAPGEAPLAIVFLSQVHFRPADRQ